MANPKSDRTHFNRARDYWESLDKDALGADDIPELVRMLDLLFRLYDGRLDNGVSTTTPLS